MPDFTLPPIPNFGGVPPVPPAQTIPDEFGDDDDTPQPPTGAPGAEGVAPPSVATPSAGTLQKYRVRLKDGYNTCPAKVVEGVDRLDAIEAYKRECGINATPHPFDIELVQ